MLCLSADAAKKKTGKKAQFPVTVVELKTERMTNPMSIDTPRPRLGWLLTSDKKDVMQTSYRIIVASTKEKAERLEGDLWDATVNSDQSQWIEYGRKGTAQQHALLLAREGKHHARRVRLERDGNVECRPVERSRLERTLDRA